MSNRSELSRETTLHVRDTCLCLHTQRAARALARRFDAVFRPLGITNGQFSLMMSLNRPDPPTMRQVAEFLAMDRTTLTAALKSLQRRDLVEIRPDESDRRSRRLRLTTQGRTLLKQAYPLWEAAHAELDEVLAPSDPERLRADLQRLATV